MKNKAINLVGIKLSFLLFLGLPALGQKWINYSNKDFVERIAVDGNKVWISSNAGIVCRDTSGNLITEYTNADGLTDNWIRSFTIDSKGNKWFGTMYGGVSKFDGIKWTTYNISNSGLAGNDIRAIAEDHDGIMWFGINGKGVSKFDGTTWTNYNVYNSGIGNTGINSIAIDIQGNKWIGACGYISKFDGVTWTTFSSTNSPLPFKYVESIAIDGQGNKWFATNGGGVLKYDGTNWTSYNSSNSSIPSNYIISVTIDAQGNKWFGTFGSGLIKFDGTNWTIFNSTNSGLADGYTYSVALDAHQNKWIATSRGIYKFDGTNWTNYKTSNSGLAGSSVNSIVIDKEGNKWISTNGVNKFDGTNWNTIKLGQFGLAAMYAYSIAIDELGNKWVGSNDGACMFNDFSHEIYKSNLPNSQVRVVVIDNLGNKWFGTDGGIAKFDGMSWTIYTTDNSGLADNRVKSIVIDNQGNKWFGTLGGVSKFDGINWATYTKTNSGLADNKVYAIAIDAQGNKWFTDADSSANTGGVSKFDGTKWTVYKMSNSGLPCSYVNSIIIDAEGIVWFGTQGKGICKFDGLTWTTYNASNSGLISNYINSITIDNQGIKWIGTNIGVSKFEDGGKGPLDLKNQKPIYGSVFNDKNGNGVRDSGEPLMPYKYVKVMNDSSIATTQDNGLFCITRIPGVYKIKFVPCQDWKLTTDSIKTIEIFDTTKQISGVNFGIKIQNVVSDVSIDLTGGIARAGFDVKYWLTYKNIGTQTKSGNVTLDIDPLVNVISSTPSPSVNNGKTLIWNYSDLVSLEQRQIALVLKMPIPIYSGSKIITKAAINPVINDVSPLNNTFSLNQIVVSSFDPNDKSVNAGSGPEGLTPLNEDLTYTIRFQNTGTDTAFSVVIRDTIHNNLNLETFKLVASSHLVKVDIKDQNVISFICDTIKLPDDKTNEPASHGFVKYTISPKANLPENTVVTNKAYIYFDFNPPVATNEVKNTYVSTLNTLTVSKNAVSIAAPSNSKATFDITSNATWVISGRPDWLTLADTVGSGNTTITITAQANPTTAIRTATLTVAGTGVAAQTITFTQMGMARVMSMTTAKPVGASFSFSLMANAANTPIQVDFGDGTLINKIVGTFETTISGTLVGSQTIKIQGSGITYLSCYNDQLTALDVSDNSSLTDLICSYNLLTSLDVTRNKALSYLHCGHNQLSALDITKNSALTVLKCYFNQFNTLDVTQNIALKTLDCSSNLLTSLDVAKNTGLSSLYVSYNQFTKLDVTKNLALTTLSCNSNQITALDVSKNTALSFLDCKNNLLSTIDVSQNSKLGMFFCTYNEFLFSTLPLKQTKWTTFSYAPQNPISIRKNLEKGDEVDLSNHLLVNGYTTIYKWKTKNGSTLVEGVDYTFTNGKTAFLKGKADSIYCEMTNITFPDFASAYVFKTSCTKVKLNTDTEDLIASGVEIYAYQKTLYIKLTYKAQVSIFDLSGRLIMAQPIDCGKTTIPLQNSGIYLIKINGNKEPVTRKVFVE